MPMSHKNTRYIAIYCLDIQVKRISGNTGMFAIFEYFEAEEQKRAICNVFMHNRYVIKIF